MEGVLTVANGGGSDLVGLVKHESLNMTVAPSTIIFLQSSNTSFTFIHPILVQPL